MSSIVLNQNRIGNFTSSEIWRLMKSDRSGTKLGAPALSYIEEKKIERKLGRSLSLDAYSRPMAWGTFLERRVFEMLGLGYQMTSDETTQHPTIEGWSGSTDLLADNKIGEVKCYQLKKFAKYQEVLKLESIEILKTEFPEEYWQMVSNAVINEVPNAEAILYCPYSWEMTDIRAMAAEYEEVDAWKYRFIFESADHELAVLPDDCEYDNITTFEFEVPKEDRDFCEERVKMGLELLTK